MNRNTIALVAQSGHKSGVSKSNKRKAKNQVPLKKQFLKHFKDMGRKRKLKSYAIIAERRGIMLRNVLSLVRYILTFLLLFLLLSAHMFFFFAHSLHYWIVDTGATKHLTCSLAGFVDYHPLPTGKYFVTIGNVLEEKVLGVGIYQLNLRCGCKLILHDVLHVPSIQYNLLSISALVDLGFSFLVNKNGMSIYLDETLHGH